jgi:hypothetical protein
MLAQKQNKFSDPIFSKGELNIYNNWDMCDFPINFRYCSPRRKNKLDKNILFLDQNRCSKA